MILQIREVVITRLVQGVWQEVLESRTGRETEAALSGPALVAFVSHCCSSLKRQRHIDRDTILSQINVGALFLSLRGADNSSLSFCSESSWKRSTGSSWVHSTGGNSANVLPNNKS